MYDKIEDTENQLVAARAKKMAIEAEKLTGDNIYKVLIYFDKLYSVMDDQEKRQLMESLLSEVQIYEERQSNGQWLKSIKFKLPIIAEDMSLSLDNDTHIETVCRLVLRKPAAHGNNNAHMEQPNKETMAAMLEAERITRNPSEKRYSNVEKALKALKK